MPPPASLLAAVNDLDSPLAMQPKRSNEALGAAVGHVFRPGSDWFFFYYRDRAASIGLGMTPLEMFLQAAGAADEPQSGGRQMPSHFFSPALHIANTSSPTGTQFLQAVGCAEAGIYAAQAPTDLGVPFAADEVVVVTSGDGTTSEGEFWEALSTASNRKLPVVFVIEDNGYAISVPVEVYTPGGSISRLVAEFPDLLVRETDGCDPLAAIEALAQASDHAHARRGPGSTDSSLPDGRRLRRGGPRRAGRLLARPVQPPVILGRAGMRRT